MDVDGDTVGYMESTSLDQRISLLEEAVLHIADMQDPVGAAFPIVGNDERSRKLNAAARRLQEVASLIRGSRM